jgi:hypothetical protein
MVVKYGSLTITKEQGSLVIKAPAEGSLRELRTLGSTKVGLSLLSMMRDGREHDAVAAAVALGRLKCAPQVTIEA